MTQQQHREFDEACRETVRRQMPAIRILVFIVLDATGSMDVFRDAAQATITHTANHFAASGLDVQFALTIFRDELEGEIPDTYVPGITPTEIREVLSRTEAVGGGSEPESALPALGKSLAEIADVTDRHKFVLFISDAGCHDPEGAYTASSVLAEMQAQKAVFFGCAPLIEPYVTFANATQGKLFEITPEMDSATFEHVLDGVKRATVRTARVVDADRKTRRMVDEYRKTYRLRS